MDRRIAGDQPATLKVMIQLLDTGDWNKITFLDPHSEATLDTYPFAEIDLPEDELETVITEIDDSDLVLIIPDDGAIDRVEQMIAKYEQEYAVVYCHKIRSPDNGKLSHFKIDDIEKIAGKKCLFIDDICDGGRTFEGLAAMLRSGGASWIGLFVTHGIFSKGRQLHMIDQVWSTDSYR